MYDVLTTGWGDGQRGCGACHCVPSSSSARFLVPMTLGHRFRQETLAVDLGRKMSAAAHPQRTHVVVFRGGSRLIPGRIFGRGRPHGTEILLADPTIPGHTETPLPPGVWSNSAHHCSRPWIRPHPLWDFGGRSAARTPPPPAMSGPALLAGTGPCRWAASPRCPPTRRGRTSPASGRPPACRTGGWLQKKGFPHRATQRSVPFSKHSGVPPWKF